MFQLLSMCPPALIPGIWDRQYLNDHLSSSEHICGVLEMVCWASRIMSKLDMAGSRLVGVHHRFTHNTPLSAN